MNSTALNQALYKLSSPVGYDYDWDKEKYNKKTNYVVVSTVIAMYSGLETYIFPANSKGEVLDWGELDGSAKGTDSHEDVLHEMGYELSNITK